jgi:hypothetical protein
MSTLESNETKYDQKFYRFFQNQSYSSAREIVPLILGLIPIASVCDIGCGEGTWLRVFREQGITDTIGVDGQHVTRDLLQIPISDFQPMDLRHSISLTRSFDLAMSLEVAEHLPESRAKSFVEDLTRLASVVLFSAAIPGQGGRDHVNEQWQTYWTSIFFEYDYTVCDVVRPKIWKNRRISYWYRQNILIFCNRHLLATFPELAGSPHSLRLSLVHPEQLEFTDALRAAIIAAPKYGKESLKRFLKM